MDVYAHRGNSADYPENTMSAFRSAIELGADGIELDVHLSRDGVPVIIHDADVARTTSGSGDVSDFYLADLKKLDAGRGEHIPTFEEVALLTRGKTKLDIEIKGGGAEEPVLQMLHDWPRDAWLISSFDWDVLRHCRRLDPDITLWVLSTGATEDAIAVAHEIGAPALALNQGCINADIVARLQEEGLGFMAWTVNDPQRAADLRDLGAAAMCTDDPATMIAALSKIRQAGPARNAVERGIASNG